VTPTATPYEKIIPGLAHPKGIGVDTHLNRIYVASRDNDVVYVLDGTTDDVLAEIPVGDEPFGIAANSVTHKVYVANFRSNDVSVIDATTHTVIKTISLSPYGEPTYVAINEDTNRVFIPLHADGRVAVIHGDYDVLWTTVSTGSGAFGVAVDPNANRIGSPQISGGQGPSPPCSAKTCKRKFSNT
jgi:YVTN family beta-propeller protein